MRLLLRGRPQPCVLEAQCEDREDGTYCVSFEAKQVGTLVPVLGVNGEFVQLNLPSAVVAE